MFSVAIKFWSEMFNGTEVFDVKGIDVTDTHVILTLANGETESYRRVSVKSYSLISMN